MAKRSYDQYCAAARALDIVGNRWTLLIARELLAGPRRYTDLLEGLPGIGPNLLAERLRELEAAGVVRRSTLPPPAASQVYEFTELGWKLKPALFELARWGMNFMGERRAGESFRLAWPLLLIKESLRPEASRGVREVYEFRVDGDAFHIRAADGEVELREEPAPEPDLVVTTDFPTFAAIGAGRLDPGQAMAEGRLQIEGDIAAFIRCGAIMGMAPAKTAAQDPAPAGRA